MRAEHRAASVGELAMKDLLYAADPTSSGSERMHEFMCVCVHSGERIHVTAVYVGVSLQVT